MELGTVFMTTWSQVARLWRVQRVGLGGAGWGHMIGLIFTKMGALWRPEFGDL